MFQRMRPGVVLLLLLLAAPPLAGQSPAAEERRSIDVAGIRRAYLLYRPASPPPGQPLPLVLVFHAAGGRADGIARHTGFSDLAEREGFVVAYPDAVGRRWNDGRRAVGPDDVGFVRALLDSLGSELGVDPRRRYAVGISNGAMFAHRLACDLPGVLAAIAPVAGTLPAAVSRRCAAPAPLSVLAFQGTADRSVPYEGGTPASGGALLSAERSLAFWAEAGGCHGFAPDTTVVDSVSDGTRLRRHAYGGCPENREIVLYTIEGGGHTWPGGPPVARRVGRVTREIDATSAIWEFFRRHPQS
jgi:polyhydroxybutyrate depolymerase